MPSAALNITITVGIQFACIKCVRARGSLLTHPRLFFFLFFLFFGFASEMAPHYGSLNTDQVLALSCTVVGVGPGGNTSMVA
jgi:hypothetical protein